MSLSSDINRNDYVGNGNVDTYNYTFRIFENTDLVVIVRNTDNVESTLALTTDYTVTGVGSSSGGTIVLVNSAQSWLDGDGDLKSNYALTIRRVLPIVQETDIRNQGAFYPEIHEDQFDKLAMIAQQQQDELSRSLKLPQTISGTAFDPELPATFAENPNTSIVVNATGDGFSVGPTTSEIANAQGYAESALTYSNNASDSANTAYTFSTNSYQHEQTAGEYANKLGSTVYDYYNDTPTGYYSAAEYAKGTLSATGGSAKDWATKTSAMVASTDYSSKEYAQGTQTRGAANGGSAKDWANYTSGTVDNTEYSSKEWAKGTQTRGAANGGSSKDWANYTGGTVDNTEYSAKHYSEASAASAALSAAYAAASNWGDVVYLTSASSPYTVTGTQSGTLFSVDTTSGSVTINLPSIASLNLTGAFTLGFLKSDTSANTITINRNGTDTISGGTSHVISVYKQGANLIPDTDASPDEWTALEFGMVKTLYSPTLYTPTTDIATFTNQSSTPANPSAGSSKVYVKTSTGKLTVLDSSGNEKSAGGVSLWATATTYAVGDLALYGNKIYVCITAHTSSSIIETDLIAKKWVLESNPVVARNSMTYGFDAEDNDTGGWVTAKHSGALTNGFPTSVGSAGVALSSSTSGYTTATTLSFATTATNPLFGTYSYNIATTSSGTTVGDMAISPIYNVPLGDQATNYTIKFTYKLVTDTNSLVNFSGLYSANSFACAIYDVTNAAWIQPDRCYNFVTKSVPGQFAATFQLPSTITQYQLVIFTPYATGATTISLVVDEFYIGKQPTSIAPAMSDWAAISGFTISNFTNCSVSSAKARQVGDTYYFQVDIGFTGATVTSGVITLNLPPTLVIDMNKLVSIAGGTANMPDSKAHWLQNGVSEGDAVVSQGTSTSVVIRVENVAGTYPVDTTISSTVPTTWKNGDHIWLCFSAPIVGKSSNTVSSADFEGKVMVASCNLTAQVVPSNVWTQITFGSTITDTNNFFSGNTVVIGSAGYYNLNLVVTCSTAVERYFGYTINDTTMANADSKRIASTNIYTCSGATTTPFLKAGDILRFACYSASTTTTFATTSSISITKQQGSPVVQATDTVAFLASRTAGNYSVASGSSVNPVQNYVKIDTNGLYNGTNSVPVPISGIYFVSYTQTVATAAAGGWCVLALTAGATSRNAWNAIDSTNVNYRTFSISFIARLKASDTISTYVGTGGSGTATIVCDNEVTNSLFFIRVGN